MFMVGSWSSDEPVRGVVGFGKGKIRLSKWRMKANIKPPAADETVPVEELHDRSDPLDGTSRGEHHPGAGIRQRHRLTE